MATDVYSSIFRFGVGSSMFLVWSDARRVMAPTLTHDNLMAGIQVDTDDSQEKYKCFCLSKYSK